MYRYLNDLKIGDRIVSYDSSRRVYIVGSILSDPFYDPELMPVLPRCRKVKWEGEVDRDKLSVSTKNSLGAISTLFQIPGSAAEELERALISKGEGGPAPELVVEDVTEEQQLDTVKEQSKEF